MYFPTLRHEILELVIEKLLKLDVSAGSFVFRFDFHLLILS